MNGDTDSESAKSVESELIRGSLEMLCQELNMDEETASEALRNFSSVWNTYTLEVSNIMFFTITNCLLTFKNILWSYKNTELRQRCNFDIGQI